MTENPNLLRSKNAQMLQWNTLHTLGVQRRRGQPPPPELKNKFSEFGEAG